MHSVTGVVTSIPKCTNQTPSFVPYCCPLGRWRSTCLASLVPALLHCSKDRFVSQGKRLSGWCCCTVAGGHPPWTSGQRDQQTLSPWPPRTLNSRANHSASSRLGARLNRRNLTWVHTSRWLSVATFSRAVRGRCSVSGSSP